jgi:hypothetical protein
VAHYAEAFSVELGQCFRFVHAGTGHARHCPRPVVCRGRFVDRAGNYWTVDACSEHLSGLDDPR